MAPRCILTTWAHRLGLVLLAALGGCSQERIEDIAAENNDSSNPIRVVSLDYCADQFLLKLADPEQILALSPDAGASFSYLRDEAQDSPTVRPRAEELIALTPDLAIRSYGGGPRIASFLAAAGVQTHQLPWVNAIDGDDANSVPGVIRGVAQAIGQEERGETLIAEYRARLAALPGRSGATTALYMTAGGATTGEGSLIHEMINAAGLSNFETRRGWHPLPLESLAYDQPDVAASAFFAGRNDHVMAWSSARHPIARDLRALPASVALDGASTACGGWFIADAMEALSGAAL